ncbi:hypothetical protein [Herbaspirillum sp.]|uniref:hypothetical protein n=1 Tax=Herbaspirillum sp. TaxID=1890675 RepID=UPI00258614BB|nr:hypothetical protein [Herbaspirillum sp.]MCP3947342.1 hypothetical protein [Herbaspirillum sp.]
MTPLPLAPKWAARATLMVEGAKLRAKGNKFHYEGAKIQAKAADLWAKVDKLRAKADKLWVKGDKLWAAGAKLRGDANAAWMGAVIAYYGGDVAVEWDNGSFAVAGDRYEPITPPQSEGPGR